MTHEYNKSSFNMKELTAFLADDDAAYCVLKDSKGKTSDVQLVKVPCGERLVAVYMHNRPTNIGPIDCLFVAKGTDIVGNVSSSIKFLLPAEEYIPLLNLQDAQNTAILDAAVDIIEGRNKDDDRYISESLVLNTAIDIFFDGKRPMMIHCAPTLLNVCGENTRLGIYAAWPDAEKAARIWLKDGWVRSHYMDELKANVELLKRARTEAEKWESNTAGAPYIMREICQAIYGTRGVTATIETQTGTIVAKLPTNVFKPEVTINGELKCEISPHNISPSLTVRRTIMDLLENERIMEIFESEHVGHKEPKSGIAISRVREIQYHGKTVYLRRDLRN